MATGLDIGLSNLSLRTITLSFYTMCKSSSLAFVLLFAFLFRLERPSWKLVGIIAVITAGVVLMVSTETKFHFAGMVEVLTASALGGLRWSLTQILLDKASMGMNNPIATLFWIAPIMGVTLATCSIVFDGWITIFQNEQFFGSFALTAQTFAYILLPGVIAFLMNVTEFGLIQRTSVVTLSVAGIFKEVATIFVSTTVFGDELTPINISGLLITLGGIAMYNVLKYRQAIRSDTKDHPRDSDEAEAESSSRAGATLWRNSSAAYSRSDLFNAGDETALFADEATAFGQRYEEVRHTLGSSSSRSSDGQGAKAPPTLDQLKARDPLQQELDREQQRLEQSMLASSCGRSSGEEWDLLNAKST